METNVSGNGEKAKIFLLLDFSAYILDNFPKLPKNHTSYTNSVDKIWAKTSECEELNLTDGHKCIDLV